MRLPRLLAAVLCSLAPAAGLAAVFTVNSTNDIDDGVCNAAHCSLREAILAANAAAGTDTIRFILGGAGAKTIQPISVLPTVTDPATIDGTTQPGFSGSPIIELDGSAAGAGANGLRITGGGSLVTGLVINRFNPAFPASGGNGIVLETGGNNVIRGNYIGTNIAGTAAMPNGIDGVSIVGSAGNVVGRTDLAFRSNVISGNGANGVRIMGAGADGNVVAGNRIGTNPTGTAAVANGSAGIGIGAGAGNVVGSALVGDTLVSGNVGDGVQFTGNSVSTVVTNTWIGVNAAGTAALPNGGQGVNLSSSTGNTVGPGNVISGNTQNGILVSSVSTNNTVTANFIGVNATGTAAIGNLFNGINVNDSDQNVIGPGNVISGNLTNGVRIRTESFGNVVKGNLIGVNAAATAAIPNLDGVQINDEAVNNTIGGSIADRNVISGNTNNGVLIVDSGTTGNVVAGNFIGSNAFASAGIPNGGDGVAIQADASGNTVGGTAADTKNVIAFNVARGVSVASGTGNAVLGNNLVLNGGLAIDLGPVGVTPNDLGDPDPGANLLQNFPLLSSIQLDTATTQVQGSLNSIATSSYRLEFFSTGYCDVSGNGPGQRFLGAADRKTDPGGNVAFVATLPSAALGPFITATATDLAGNTSEFSACLAVPGPTASTIDPTSGPAAGATPVSITGLNFQNGAAVKFGGVAATGVAVLSGTEIDASTPALPPGTLNDVTVTNPSGLAATLPAAFLADFADVPQANIFHGDVEKVFRAGITAGCGGGAYCVTSAVTRAQMAVFLLKAEHGSSYVPPNCAGIFDDVLCPSQFANWIEQLFAEGITAGCGNDNYCPNNPVRRDQMAVFLLKTDEGSAYTPPACTTPQVFEDVACPGPFSDWIEELYERGITGGCSTTPLLYCPDASNTRGQMSVFLVKTFGL
jgi:CSLREA domain-containing protein